MESFIAHIKGKCSGRGRVGVALSGGVDSSLVLAASKIALPGDVLAITVESDFTTSEEVNVARGIADDLEVEHHVLSVDVLDDISVRANRADRCYHCKKLIFTQIIESLKLDVLMDGTNYEDDLSRPGMRAARELAVVSPLKDCGLRKEGVRALARAFELKNWNKPSESCLAARIKTGVEITGEGLDRVVRMESFFHKLGVETLRAHHDNLMATVAYLPQYASIIEENRGTFAALVHEIGLVSFEFKEFRE